jgi:hypothetical protein
MANTIALLFRNAPESVCVTRTMQIEGFEIEVSAAAFYDIFDTSQKLEDFVRSVAAGEFEDPEQAAIDLMDAMKFA